MDDDRIIRIARALCRSARLDPDKPVDDASRVPLPAHGPVSASAAAWVHFRKAAEDFVARHSERVVAPL